jgi:cyclic lactone autoinducer peptide
VSWEGYAVTVAFLLGMALLQLEGERTRRAIAMALVAVAYCAVVVLTWGDPDSGVRQHWRETLFNRQTLVWLAVLLALAAAFVAANVVCGGCYHQPVSGWHAGARTLR